ncbi:MAG: short-chain dehydrogenase [Gammaproteobacteria bacterium]|nr:short-chain dehydrogenase [Gammaproteobacteria bacterium]
MENFQNKTAVITGAGSGMGRYLSVLLAKAGCNVAICDIDEDSLVKTSEMISQYNVASSQHVVDIGNKEKIDEFYENVMAHHESVDLVFNNAGITVVSDFENLEEKDWDRVIDINFHGVINISRKFLPHLRSRPEGALINTSSIFGMVAVPNQSVYHAAKFAVRGFTESLAKEMKDTNLQVHSVHPGHIGTNILAKAKRIRSGNDQVASGLVSLNSEMTDKEEGEIFRDNGMHPSRAAKIILEGVIRKNSRILVGLDAKVMDLTQRLFPNHYQKLWPLVLVPVFAFRRNLRKPLPGIAQES